MDRKAVSAITLTLMLLSMLTLAFNSQPVKASETIYIRPDGMVEGTDKIQRNGDVYTFTDNIYDSIVVERDNIVVDGAGYTIQGTGSGEGITLSGSNVIIKNMEIRAFYYGIWLNMSSSNSICGNNITNNLLGIQLEVSTSNTISGNNITANDGYGIRLRWYCNNNSISGNNVANNGYGIGLLEHSNYNSISENNITANDDGEGIGLLESSGNTIYGNNAANNDYGISLYKSSNNVFCHNNFVNNTLQVSSYLSVNAWDDGYPSGGNYWSDYAGVDLYGGPHQNETGSDGIGDTPYFIDGDNQDNYPLMGMFYDFSLWYGMTAICNSTIYDFHAGYIITKEGLKSSIDFNVVGPSNTTGFCRIIIPRDFMEGPYTVLVHNEEVDATELPISNSTHAFLYFNYPNFAHIKITEFPPTPPVVKATVDVDPDALNLKSKGKWISAYIELPEDYDIRGIDRTTVTLNDTIPVDPFWVDKPLESVIGDYDNDGIADLIVKFDRQVLIEYIRTEGITEAEVTLSITGKATGKSFEATDTIKVIGQ